MVVFTGKEETSGVQLAPASFANFCVSLHLFFRFVNFVTDSWRREEPFDPPLSATKYYFLWLLYVSSLCWNRHPSQEVKTTLFFLPTKFCAVQNIDMCEQFRHLFIIEASRHTVNQKRVKMINGTWQCSQWPRQFPWISFLRARGHCGRQRRSNNVKIILLSKFSQIVCTQSRIRRQGYCATQNYRLR